MFIMCAYLHYAVQFYNCLKCKFVKTPHDYDDDVDGDGDDDVHEKWTLFV